MNLFTYDSYKSAIKDLIHSRGSAKRGSLRKMAEHLGVHATLVSQVLSGSKDFTEEQIFSVCEFLGVGKAESEYLHALVQIERAGSKRLKSHYLEVKETLRRQATQFAKKALRDRTLSEAEKAVFYSTWIYSAVHMLTTLDEKPTFEEIRSRLNLSAAKTREVVDFLIRIQMVAERGGRFHAGSTSTHLEKDSPYIPKHHINWRLKAIEATEDLSDEELMYTANLTIGREDFLRLREELTRTIQRFFALVKDSPAEDVAQFNLDLFWLQN